MIGRTNHHKTIARHGNESQSGVIDCPFGKSEIGCAVKDGGRYIGGVAFAEHHADRWMRRLEANQERRKPIAGNSLAGLYRERSALKATNLD